MKFLEVKTFNGHIALINIEKIIGLYAINDIYYIGAENFENDLKISKSEYERITQTIVKVDHL